MSRTAAGSFAAAGMLAPQSERLPDGPLLDLCTRSRDGYSVFVDEVEGLARDSGERGRGYLWDDAAGGGRTALLSDDDDEEGEGGGGSGGGKGKEPWRVGYKSTGGFLAPAFAGDSVATWAPPSGSGSGREGGGGGDPPPADTSIIIIAAEAVEAATIIMSSSSLDPASFLSPYITASRLLLLLGEKK